jgi:DNA-binding CsgD family transcriptional regulator
VLINLKGASPLRADLGIARTRDGAPFLIVELDVPGISPQVRETAARFRLSAAEAEVLGLLARGHADRQIGRKLFVSLATVRSHVGQILGKLGVRSRVQAALLANGLKPDLSDTDAH